MDEPPKTTVVKKEEEVEEENEVEGELTVTAQELLEQLDAPPLVCRYLEGYITQNVYVCLTCNPESKGVMAGICESCSVECHPHHDVRELWSKRSFRCDCGTKDKFPSEISCDCEDEAVKESKLHTVNDRNKYNHNFFNEFCYCDKFYTGEDTELEAEMVKCFLCEDWFHLPCINKPSTGTVNFDALSYFCRSCTKSYKYLAKYAKLYPDLFLLGHQQPPFSSITIKSEGAKSEQAHQLDENPSKRIKVESSTFTNETTSASSIAEVAESQSSSAPNSTCSIASVELDSASTNNDIEMFAVTTALKEKICKCKECMELYSKDGIEFLVDVKENESDDEPEIPEISESIPVGNGNPPANNNPNEFDRAMQQFDQLPRNQQYQLLDGYQQLRSKLFERFQQIIQSGRSVVTDEDIKEVIRNLTTEQQM